MDSDTVIIQSSHKGVLVCSDHKTRLQFGINRISTAQLDRIQKSVAFRKWCKAGYLSVSDPRVKAAQIEALAKRQAQEKAQAKAKADAEAKAKAEEKAKQKS